MTNEPKNPFPAQEKSLVIDIPCVGDRRFGLVQEQEMLVAFRELRDRMDPLIASIKPSDRIAADAASIKGNRTEG